VGMAALRRYHKPLAPKGPEVEPGLTDTPELADEAALAEAAQIAKVQEEQREMAAAADPSPEGDAINDVLEGIDPEVSAEHQDERPEPDDRDEPEAPADGEPRELDYDAPPKRNASTEVWREYVAGHPAPPKGWEDMSRDDLAVAILGKPQG